MMELRVSGAELQTLLEMGVLTNLIEKCTVAGPEAEEPKKKPARKAKKKEEPKEEAKPVSTNVANETAASVVEDPTVPPMEEPKPDITPAAVPEADTETFSVEQLAQKAVALMDKGRGGELQSLLQRYGVNSLPELKPEQYSGFYASLCDMEG